MNADNAIAQLVIDMGKLRAAQRLVAARRLQKFGFALANYAKGIERAILKRETHRERIAVALHERATERFQAFAAMRRMFRAWR